jgi:hypothetical protein
MEIKMISCYPQHLTQHTKHTNTQRCGGGINGDVWSPEFVVRTKQPTIIITQTNGQKVGWGVGDKKKPRRAPIARDTAYSKSQSTTHPPLYAYTPSQNANMTLLE